MNKINTIGELPGRFVRLDDQRQYLWFSGTDYLGMGHNEAFHTFLREGLDRYGTHFGSSRNNTLRLAVYEEAETALAAFAGTPAALTVSSGMWAGQLVMKYLESRYPATGARYYYAPRVHPALWGTTYHPHPHHLSWADWAEGTLVAIGQSPVGSTHILCTDSVGSPWVEAYDFSVFRDLPTDRELWLVVDDSHGLGVLGHEGRGITTLLPPLPPNLQLVVVSSLNKALGIPAGVLLADAQTIREIRTLPWFAGSSPSAPAYQYAMSRLLQTGEYLRAHRVLMEHTAYFAGQLRQPELLVQYPHYPVFGSRSVALYQYLRSEGILSACFPYPRPTDEPVMRLVLSTLHHKEDLDRLAEVLGNFNEITQ
jgi:8-amino-7-oxononanoate synthase